MIGGTPGAGITSDLIDVIVGRGRVYDLGQRIFAGMPISPNHPPYTLTLARRHGDLMRDGGITTANELIVMCAHTGTHLDALGHASRNGRLHGGLDVDQTQRGGRGLTALGIEEIDPIVCRGVLLDVATARGTECLPPGYAIGAGELEATARRQGIEVRPGDAVLVRTGWMRHWDDRERYVGATTGTPGPDESAARWLAERGARVTGADTIPYEARRAGGSASPVHALLLVDAGIPIIEVLDLEALARDRVYSFLFVVSPLKLVGATGSPVRPIAIA